MPGLSVKVIHTPGHTPEAAFKSGKACLAGDTLFAGAVGRTDLPGGVPVDLINSLRLMDLPNHIDVYPGHGRDDHWS